MTEIPAEKKVPAIIILLPIVSKRLPIRRGPMKEATLIGSIYSPLAFSYTL
jgi:hypothetical protein